MADAAQSLNRRLCSDHQVFVPNMLYTRLHIDGQAVDASTGETLKIVNPLTKEVTSECASASLEDVKRACDAAAAAFESWEALPLNKKAEILNKTAELLESPSYTKRFVDALTQECAMVRPTAAQNVVLAAAYFRHAATLKTQMQGFTFDSDVPGGLATVRRRGAGVVFSAVPWNSPPTLTARALAVPLFCGNTTVLKASEMSPMSTYIVCEALWEAGLPKNVLQFIVISRENSAKLTEAIIAHPKVMRVTFTGSHKVGSLIASVAGRYLKQCVMELGGKNPSVVLADADLERAARAIVFSSNSHSGQICMGTERIICHQAVADKLVSFLKHHVSRLSAGKDRPLGPLFSDAAAKNVISHLEDAVNRGAEMLVGDLKADGATVQPHLLTDVPPDGKSWYDETFGPVCMVTVARDDEHAIELANDTQYSLTAALWTRDLQKGTKLGNRLRAGTVMLNGPSIWVEQANGNAGLGGLSGYGRFDVPHFSDLRTLVICPPTQQYPLSQPIESLGENGAAPHQL